MQREDNQIIYNSRNFIRYLNQPTEEDELISTTVEILFGT